MRLPRFVELPRPIFDDFLAASLIEQERPEDNEEHAETLTWCGEPFDPTRADLRALEAASTASLAAEARARAPRPKRRHDRRP